MKNQNTIFSVGIPTINRADLLQETLEKYSIDFPNTPIHILDNGMQEFDFSKFGKNIYFHTSPTNKGVAASWNYLLEKIYSGHLSLLPSLNALILNDDIYLGKKENEINRFIIENDLGFYTPDLKYNWSAFLISKFIFSKVGLFDENFFPAYFEDNDYAFRLKIAGFSDNKSDFLNPIIYRNSQTIFKDPSLNNRFQLNREYFIAKWGGIPFQETFLTPFNKYN